MTLNQIIKDLEQDFDGVSRGIKFIEKFTQDVQKIQKKSENIQPKSEIKIFNILTSETKIYFFNQKFFEIELREYYKNFVMSNFYANFPWYNKFNNSITNTVKQKFKIEDQNNYFNTALTTIFTRAEVPFEGYSYKIFNELLVDYLNFTGFEDSAEIANELISGLVNDGLLLLNNNFLGSPKTFNLSDRYFSVVFGITSMFLPCVFPDNEYSIGYGSAYGVLNLKSVIDNFFQHHDSKENLQLAKFSIYLEYPELMEKLNNFKDIVLDFDCVRKKTEKDTIFAMYMLKLMLNEFCFQTIVMSMFEKYYATSAKNILFNKHNHGHHLYH